jgi:PAS domain S-box-containing protein
MSAHQYPFIDIAVHKDVRERFVRGEALALFSMDLTTALWANGRGAALFGEPLIYDFLDQGPKHSEVTFRQLASVAARLEKLGDEQQFTIRVTAGFRSLAVPATAKIIETEAGVSTILFSAAIDDTLPSFETRASRMIEGFDDPDIHMAVLNGDGTVVAASGRFAFLGITQQTTQALIALGSRQVGNLVKRPILTGKGFLPAASGKLQDEPELHLLFAVETILGQMDAVSEPSETPTSDQVLPHSDEALPLAVPPALEDALDAITHIDEIEEEEAAISLDELNSDFVPQEDVLEPIAPDQVLTEVSADDLDEQAATVSDDGASVPAPSTESEAPVDFTFNPTARASRFVWKIDADGRFSAVSSEFAEAVGPLAADVIGMKFIDIDMLFDLDPEGKISEALMRRDTWSGKTVYWPVENTTKQVPIDLAALPTYTRAREFDGFRGFGIVRSKDTVEDPSAMGMMLSEVFGQDDDEATAPINSVAPTAPTDQPQPEQQAGDAEVLETVEIQAPDRSEDEIDPAEYENQAKPEVRDTATPEPAPVATLDPAPTRAGLSLSEQAAFREIARALGPIDVPDAVVAAEDATANTDAQNAEVSEENIEAPSAPEASALAGDLFAQLEAGDVSTDEHNSLPAQDATTDEHDIQRVVEALEPINSVSIDEAEAIVSTDRSDKDNLTADVVDQMPVALLVQVGNRLVHANPEFLKLTGYQTIEELVQVGGLDSLLQRDDLDQVTDNPGGMLAVSSDNELIPVKARLQSVKWQDASALMLSLQPVGEVLPAVSSIEAVAAQVANTNIAPTILEEEVEELRSILETATDGVVLLGEDGTIRSLNRSASALFNYDNGDIAGKPFVNLFAHESQRAVLDYLSSIANNGVASVLNDGRELIGREINGGFIPLFMTIGQLKASNGYCAVIRDITQWKRTEEELRNAKRSAETANAHKTEFLARVSHEIRTPLNAIIGFSDIMATERFGPVGHPRYVEYANDIGRSGRHVLDIVNDLLDISKIEAGQMDVEFTAVALNETIAEAVSIIQPQANNQRVIIRTALSRSVPQIVADLRSIKQIVLNILSNAIRFTPSGGQIVVSTSYETTGSVILRIRDTGIGMTRAELEHAMKPFRQVSSSTKRVRGDGTGLGLPLTKAMVDANRADFSISSAPNEGTLVEISFPSQRVLAN